MKNSINRIVGLAIAFLIVMAAAIVRDHKLLGRDLQPTATADTTAQVETLRLAGDTTVVNTTPIGKDISGYGGPVPLEIYIKDGTVAKVVPLPNHESEVFFNRAADGLLKQWTGKKVAEASQLQVDAVSGATYSSKAIIANMQRGLAAYAKAPAPQSSPGLNLDWKTALGLLVALLAAIVPLFVHNRRYRLVQQVLNVVVLGFLCGSFVSYEMLIGFASNGILPLQALLPMLILMIAFVYPLFGKEQYYCANVCPFGSLQEMAGRVSKRKPRLSQKLLKGLNNFRSLLWAVLLLCLWTGLWTYWTQYELFTAFLTSSATVGVIVVAVLFVVLSVFVPRPYCHFVCPTGMLLRLIKK